MKPVNDFSRWRALCLGGCIESVEEERKHLERFLGEPSSQRIFITLAGFVAL